MLSNKNLQLTAVVISVLIVFLFGIGLYSFVSHFGKTKVTVSVLPEDSTILLNGSPIKAGTRYLSPGHYTFVAKRTDFGSVSKSLDLVQGSKPQSVNLLPLADTAAALEYLQKHPEIQQKREAAGGEEFANNVSSLSKKYPIIGKLPAYTEDYRIDYSVDSAQNISFAITLYAILNNPQQYQQYQQQLQQDKSEALQFLNDNGIDPTKVTITYTPNV